MRRRLTLLPILAFIATLAAYADGGMWLLKQIEGQATRMKQLGLQLETIDVYNPNDTSLKDAIIMFDGGCSGAFVSSQGLILTNHHCGYDQIQQHSSVEHNYLRDGFWSHSLSEELTNPGLEVEVIDAIMDVTGAIQKHFQKTKMQTGMEYLSAKYLSPLAEEIVGKKAYNRRGYRYEIKPFYGGNRYYMFVKKVFRDVRLVAAPPSSIGKFGSDTDNWSWPRHTGDFSIFRVYVDKNGNPADYSPHNVPYRPKKWLQVSGQGVQEGDFALIMGFPGTTYKFFTADEVTEWSEIDNNIRIEMRQILQEEMLRQMLQDPAINIMYASKYATSQNGYKRAQGANWAIRRRSLREIKEAQQQEVLQWSLKQGSQKASQAVADIAKAVAGRKELRTRQRYLLEGVLLGIEMSRAPIASKEFVVLWNNPKKRAEAEKKLREQFDRFFNKDYSPQVDKAIATALLSRYVKQIPTEQQPEAIRQGIDQYGSAKAYVAAIFEQSIFASRERFEQFMQAPNIEQLQADLMSLFAASVRKEYSYLNQQVATFDAPLAQAQKSYVGEVLRMIGEENLAPDANLTLRFTYGQIKGYQPRDVVTYGAISTLEGIMEKEDPTSWEFEVSPKLKELYAKRDFGLYANKNGTMPVNFCATTHTTGGNSGSAVMNARGELIGLNFDRNWEGVGGDIEYLPNYQRSIILDIRYLLFIVEKVGECNRLIEEMQPKF